ncbi:hypothetical protein ACQ4WX_50595 [Streptomyces lasalocidi]
MDELTTERGCGTRSARSRLHVAVREHAEGGARRRGQGGRRPRPRRRDPRAKVMALTRPHPSAPSTPRASKLLSPGVGWWTVPVTSPPGRGKSWGFGDVPGAGPPGRDARPTAPKHELGTA